MSIQSEITRINGLKSTLRTKLVALGLVQASADLSGCVDAVDGIENRGAVEGSITTAAGSYTIAAGYHNGKGKVAIAAADYRRQHQGRRDSVGRRGHIHR